MRMYQKPSGWQFESQRHSLAAKGIKTTYYTKKYPMRNFYNGLDNESSYPYFVGTMPQYQKAWQEFVMKNGRSPRPGELLTDAQKRQVVEFHKQLDETAESLSGEDM